MGRWVRCIVTPDTSLCKLIDTGSMITLLPTNEEQGIYVLETRFHSLPPRAILCGLGNITPMSANGQSWAHRASELFKSATHDRSLKAYFCQAGLFDNSAIIFLSAISLDGGIIHVNTLLVAFDAAVPDVTGLHHPVWPTDETI